MLDGLLNKRSEVVAWIDEHYEDLKEDNLTREDWLDLAEFCNFLKLFKVATKCLQGDYCTLNQSLATMDYLITYYAKAKEQYSANSTMLTRIMTSWYKFDCYYELIDKNPLYPAALLLYPSLCEDYLNRVWAYQKQYI